MISASQILSVVVEFLSHNDSDKFVREFAALSYNIHKTGDAEAVALARAIEFKMADLRSGCIQKPAFLIALRQLLLDGIVASNIQASVSSEPVNIPAVVESASPEWTESFGTLPARGCVSERLVPA